MTRKELLMSIYRRRANIARRYEGTDGWRRFNDRRWSVWRRRA